jgi:hypothetical protein
MAGEDLPSFHGIIGRSAAMQALFAEGRALRARGCTHSDTGRVGDGQGAGSEGDPAAQRTACAAVRDAQLRRSHAGPPPERAVRSRAGRVHRGGAPDGGPRDPPARRHAVHGRDRRVAARRAGDAAPVPAGGRGPARRSSPEHHRRRARDRGDASGSRGGGGTRHGPRGLLLPAPGAAPTGDAADPRRANVAGPDQVGPAAMLAFDPPLADARDLAIPRCVASADEALAIIQAHHATWLSAQPTGSPSPPSSRTRATPGASSRRPSRTASR